MSNKKHEEKNDITLAELATEMREGFKSVHEKLAGLETYTRSGFETMNEKSDTVEENLSQKIRFEISRLEERTFSPDEKDSIMDTVKLVNNQLDTSVLGKGAITLTREEYDAASRAQGFPSRFERIAELVVE